MTDVYVSSYDADSIYRHYLELPSDELVTEYQAVKECHEILLSGNSDLANSYMGEFAESMVSIMREVMAARYIDMISANRSVQKIVRLVGC